MDKRLVDGYLSKTAELLDELEGKVRRVRDPEFWGKPYGTVITPGMKPMSSPNKPMTVRISQYALPKNITVGSINRLPNRSADEKRSLKDGCVDYVKKTVRGLNSDDDLDAAIKDADEAMAGWEEHRRYSTDDYMAKAHAEDQIALWEDISANLNRVKRQSPKPKEIPKKKQAPKKQPLTEAEVAQLLSGLSGNDRRGARAKLARASEPQLRMFYDEIVKYDRQAYEEERLEDQARFSTSLDLIEDVAKSQGIDVTKPPAGRTSMRIPPTVADELSYSQENLEASYVSPQWRVTGKNTVEYDGPAGLAELISELDNSIDIILGSIEMDDSSERARKRRLKAAMERLQATLIDKAG